MRKSSTGSTKTPPAKSGPPQSPPTDAKPTKQRYNMASTGMGKPGKVGPLGK